MPPLRVLIVQRDPAYADLLAQRFQQAGFSVIRCAGPHPPDYYCYLFDSEPPPAVRAHRPRLAQGSYGCPLVEAAEVLIYDPWLYTRPGSPDARDLIRALRRCYPDQPLVLAWAEEGMPAFEPDLRFDPGVYIGPSDPEKLVQFVSKLSQRKEVEEEQ